MEYNIFFSWQSDLPSGANRTFIEDALRRAADAVTQDDTIEVEPVIDRDTAGVSGSPDISSTILRKIDAAQSFVADVSIINKGAEGRLTPNPNVLFELGYAAHHLSWDRIVLVFNTAYGRLENLPFDLRGRRTLTYNAMPGEGDRRIAKKALADGFEQAIRDLIESAPAPNPVPAETPFTIAMDAIEYVKPNRVVAIKKFWEWLDGQLEALAPNWSDKTVERDELLLASIRAANPLFVQFAQLASLAAGMDSDVVPELAAGFQRLLQRYDLPKGFSGQYTYEDFDFYKFAGHELYVDMVALLMENRRWNHIKALFEVEYFSPARQERGLSPVQTFDRISEHLRLLAKRKDRLKLNRLSIHADVLHDLHTQGELPRIVSFESFIAADFLLFLRSGIGEGERSWFPRSAFYMSQTPQFVLECRRTKNALVIADVLGDSNILQHLKDRVSKHMEMLIRICGDGWIVNPVRPEEIEAIGTA